MPLALRCGLRLLSRVDPMLERPESGLRGTLALESVRFLRRARQYRTTSEHPLFHDGDGYLLKIRFRHQGKVTGRTRYGLSR